MRIIAGEHRGRLLDCPSNDLTRPTTDRVRESLFAILDSLQARGDIPKWQDIYAIDGFCGAGTLGLEALSRGASHVTFIDDNAPAILSCKKNIASCKISSSQATTLQQNILNLPEKPNHVPAANLIFLDPPYGHGLGYPALQHLQNKNWLCDAYLCILESDKKHPETLPQSVHIEDERMYGRTRLQFIHSSADA